VSDGSTTDTGTVNVTVTPPCAPGVCIDNDTILLAVHPEGHLNVSDGSGSAAGPGDVGLHFIPTGHDGTSPGCLCEGWGAADADSGVSGYANESTDGGANNMTVESFTNTETSAVSVVNIEDTLRVTHDYHPSPATPNLYEATVTIENISGAALDDVRYRRVMDWDIEPTAFAEVVTIDGGNASELLFSSNDGFASTNPLSGPSDIGGLTGDFVDQGPEDHGALFDFGFSSLAAGAETSFTIFYGAAATEDAAEAAVTAAGAEVFSFGQPSTEDGPTLGTPNTFIFAFAGVGGDPVFAPEAHDDTLTTAEDTAAAVNVLANDSDPNGDPLSVTTPSPSAAHGTVACTAAGVCTYTPQANYHGPDSFTYTVSDGADTDTATVNITVTSVKDAPEAHDDLIETEEGVPGSANVLANDVDVDEDELEISEWTQGQDGSVECEGTDCTYAPEDGFSGTDPFTYTVADGNGGEDTATVNVTVAGGGPNTPPEAADDVAIRVAAPIEVPVLENDSDLDGDPLEVTTVTAPTHGTAVISPDKQFVTYEATGAFQASDSFTYSVSDGQATDTATVTLTPCPVMAPALDEDGIVTSERWIACSSLTANGQTGELTPVLPPSGDKEALFTSGDVANAPGPNEGAGTGENNGTELRGAFDVSILRLDLTVPAGANCLSFELAFQSEEFPEFVNQGFNDGFLAELDSSDWAVEGEEITAPHNFAFDDTGSIVSVNSSFFDAGRVITDTGSEYDGSTPRLTVRTPVTPGAHSLYVSIFDAGDNALDSGAFVDRLRAFSAPGETCEAGASDNEPPTAVDDTLTTAEDTPGSVTVLDNDSDPDEGQTLSFTANTDGAHGTVACSGGSCTYTPAANYQGPDSFTYTVSDGHGGTDTATVAVTVNPVNDDPNAINDTLSVDEDDSNSKDVLANDTDVDGDNLEVTSPTPTAAHGTVTCTAAGECAYTPDPNYYGSDSFTYTVSDGHGGSDTATVNVTVTPVNDGPPVADADSLTTAEDTPGTVDVLDGDTDPDNDPLTVTSLAPAAAHGSVSCTAAGDCTYTPAANFHGSDSFDYTVSDGHGGTHTATVSVTVNPLNDDPNAVNDTLSVDEDASGSLNVLANDTDVDGDNLQVTSPMPTAAHGTVACTAAGECTYTPAANNNGLDSFTYTISDGHGGSDTATVNVTVTPVNDAPNAINDALTTAQGTAGSVNVRANDTDPDGDPLSVTPKTNGAHGTVACTTAGVCTYTPAAGFSGADSFTYTVKDGHGGTDTATVAVTVTPVATNHPPSCANVHPSVKKLWPPNHTFRLVKLLGATDPDGDKLTFEITKVTQDEPVKRVTGRGDKAPDAKRVNGHPNWIKLRAERKGNGNGRVYRIHYIVSDGEGGTCSGVEKVGVPKQKKGSAIDSGRVVNSFKR
jgi:large repetitive protein